MKKQFKKEWRAYVSTTNSHLTMRIIELKRQLELKEKNILALIERNLELEADLRYEVCLNENLKDTIENNLKKVAK